MSNALSSLIREHQLIARVADALDVYATVIAHDALVEPEDLARFAQVFNDFADELHHEKEENILLPLLSRHGFDWQSEVLTAVRQDHRQERYLIAVLGQAGARPASWSPEYRRQIAAATSALSEFQRNHHRLENDELFPQVLARLDAETLDRLQLELERFDANPHNQARRASAEQVARDLIQRYLPDVPVATSQAGALPNA